MSCCKFVINRQGVNTKFCIYIHPVISLPIAGFMGWGKSLFIDYWSPVSLRYTKYNI